MTKIPSSPDEYYIPPLADAIISKVFENMETAEAARSLINAVLTDGGRAPLEKITDLQCQQTLPGSGLGTHSCRLDVSAESEGHILNIEVQRYDSRYMIERSFFYAAAKLHGVLGISEEYSKLPKLTMINLLDSPALRTDDPDIHQQIALMYTKGKREIATDLFHMHNIELRKFRDRQYDKHNPLHRWIRFVLDGYRRMKDPDIKEVLAMDSGLSQFAQKYDRSLKDPQTRTQYDIERIALLDHNSMINDAERMGEARGEEKMLRTMLKTGMFSPAQIWLTAQSAGIPKERYEQIRREETKQ